jgi:hypothetical protein
MESIPKPENFDSVGSPSPVCAQNIKLVYFEAKRQLRGVVGDRSPRDGPRIHGVEGSRSPRDE